MKKPAMKKPAFRKKSGAGEAAGPAGPAFLTTEAYARHLVRVRTAA
ncbi:hypothetical protein AB0E96_41105 [Kitasatospora sp. NPDC036755]